MREINAPLKLDVLDDDHVVFVGVEKTHVRARNMLGMEVEGEMEWPRVALPREVWDELGCPTVLLLSLALAEVTQ